MVYQANAASFYVCGSTVGYDCASYEGLHPPQGVKIRLGAIGDVPVLGDFNGDGAADISVFHATAGADAGTWMMRPLERSGSMSADWGLAGDVPAAGGIREVIRHLYQR